jgi:diphthine-ammonia ligase
LKVAALFSGGKDSTFAISQAKDEGHKVQCLITIIPLSEDSMLLHYPNILLTKLQSESMMIPQLIVESTSNDTERESDSLDKALSDAKTKYEIEGVVHGGILSEFQKKIFSKACLNHKLKIISPLWNKNPKNYMNSLIDSNFHFIVVSVTSSGLDDSWLGKEITKDDILNLEKLSNKHGFNLNFEGGEAETFVIDCPLFSNPIKIEKFKKIWDGYRGRFEILEANLD